jgi:ABC-2 type transport system permease protein
MLSKIISREWQRILQQKTLYRILIPIPLLLFITLAGIYQQRVIVDLPIAVVDRDNSRLSRTLIRSLDATRSLKVRIHYQSVDDIREGILRGEIQGGVFIPADMESDIKHGKSVSVMVYKNTANLIIGNLILKDALTTIRTVSAGIQLKRQQAKGLPYDNALAQVNPIRLETSTLYNPAYNYINFLIPGLLAVMLQMIAVIAMVYSFAGEFKEGNWPTLLRLSRNSIWKVLVGKSLPHLMLNAITALALLGVLFPLFGVPLHGPFWLVYGFIILMLAAACAIGVMIAAIFKDLMLSSEAAVFLTTPAFIFSGYTFPVEAMPKLHQLYAGLLPSTHFMTGFIKLYQMGTPARAVAGETLSLLAFFLIPLGIAWAVLKFRNVNPKRKGQ